MANRDYAGNNGFVRFGSSEGFFAGILFAYAWEIDNMWLRIFSALFALVISGVGFSHVNRGINQIVEKRDLEISAGRSLRE